jgi:trimeric autotransporter adhesin
MPMNNRILRPLARPLLLDAVPGAAAAYSLRQLSNAYTGPVVTVRRSSDNAEADFTASEIDDGTLTAFCGAGDGLVKTWHDQSGSGNDASQGTAANQPKIVASGSLVTVGGKAALDFDGINDCLASAEFASLSTPVFAFILFSEQDATADYRFLFDGSQANNRFALYKNQDGTAESGKYTLYGTNSSGGVVGVNASLGFSVGQQSLVSAANIGGASTLYANGAQAGTGGAALDGSRLLTIGARFSLVQFAKTKMQELLIYQSDQTANRERIEGDLAWYY